MFRNFVVRFVSIATVLSMMAFTGSTSVPALTATASGLTPALGLTWDLQRPESHMYADHMGPRSLATGPYGLLYTAFGGSHLYLYEEDEITTSTETVDPAWGVGLYASLALDSSYNPRISYIDQFNSRLKYASKYNGSWTIETLDALIGAQGHTSLALNNLGLGGQNPGITYYAWDSLNSRGVLKYAYKTCLPLPCHWVYQTVDSSSGKFNGESSSIGYDSSNHAVIAYSASDHETYSYLKVAAWSGTNWVIGTLDGGVALDSIAMANSGNIFYISYEKYDGVTGQNDIMAVWSTNGAAGPWSTPAVVDNSAAAKGYTTSVVLNNTNAPSIAYGYDVLSSSERLEFAQYVGGGGNCPGSSGVWKCEVAEPSYPDRVMPDNFSVAMAEDGVTPLIAYTNGLQDDSELWLNIKALGNPWSATSLANLDEQGYLTSQALDPAGMAHISHVGKSGGLFFTEQTGATTWSTIQVTDHVQWSYFTISLALDTSSNNPIIAFVRYGNLMAAHWVATGGNCGPSNTWQCDTVAAASISGAGYVSLAIYNHIPYIAFHDYTNNRLALASYVGTGGSGCAGASTAWKCVVLDSPGTGETDTGYYVSLAISPTTGQAAIAYGVKTPSTYKLKAITGSITSLAQGTVSAPKTVRSDLGNNSAGGFLSVAYGDHPHISYYQSLPGSIGVGHAEYVGSGGTGCNDAAWKCELLVTTGTAGLVPFPRQTSIAADAAGNVAISYGGLDPNFYTTLYVLHYVGSGGNVAGGHWYGQCLPGVGETGTDSSIKLDSRGLPRVSVYDNTTGHLRYAVSGIGVFIPVVKK